MFQSILRLNDRKGVQPNGYLIALIALVSIGCRRAEQPKPDRGAAIVSNAPDASVAHSSGAVPDVNNMAPTASAPAPVAPATNSAGPVHDVDNPAPASSTPPLEVGRRLRGAEIDRLRPLLAQLVQRLRENLYPDDDAGGAKPYKVGVASEVRLGQENLVVVPLQILFADTVVAHCRLAVVRGAPPRAELVPLPIGADHDACRRMRDVATVDLNHDGVPDFAFSLDIPSNRYAATVSEGAIYLSNGSARSYCYAPKISPLAEPALVIRGGATALQAAVDESVSRLGPRALDCFEAGADGGIVAP